MRKPVDFNNIACSQSYTVYVAATIHVRIAAQRGAGSEAARLLHTCLQALNENAATNPGVGKMYAVICGVMARLGVVMPVTDNTVTVGESSEDEGGIESSN